MKAVLIGVSVGFKELLLSLFLIWIVVLNKILIALMKALKTIAPAWLKFLMLPHKRRYPDLIL